MNYREIIGPDELDWKVIPLDWKKIGKGELKLGTPMSKDGVVSNDASCYGILMDDVQKDKHFQARVIVSGCVDFAKAEEYSGIKISSEAKKAIGKVWSQGGGSGPIDPKCLPEGYPYKAVEKTALVENMSVDPGYHTPSSYAVDFEFTAGEVYTVKWNGENYECTAAIMEGIGVIGNMVLMDAGDNTGEPFVMYAYGGSLYVKGEGDTVTLSIYGLSETIHPMSEEFLPAGVGGGAFIVNVTVGDDGTCTADKTFAEMEEAYLSGKVLEVVEKQTTEHMTGDLVYNLNQYMSNPQQVLSFVNIMPGGVNFRFNHIMFMEGMSQKITYTMTGEFTA